MRFYAKVAESNTPPRGDAIGVRRSATNENQIDLTNSQYVRYVPYILYHTQYSQHG